MRTKLHAVAKTLGRRFNVGERFLSQAEEFLIERLVSEETRIALDFKSSELRKIAQEERQKVADMRRAEAAFALASKAAAAS